MSEFLLTKDKKSRVSTRKSGLVQFSSVRCTLERLLSHFHCEKLWMVPIESFHTAPFFRYPSVEVPSTHT